MGRFSEITFQENRPITGTVNSEAFDIRNNPTWAIRAQWDAPAAAATFTDAEIVNAADTITITAHGYYTGTKAALTTDGVLPTGLTATTYYVIKVDADTVKLASSYANALAGTAIAFAADGSGTHTLTPTATLTGTVKVQCSLDNSAWEDLSGQSQAISGAGSKLFVNASADAGYGFVRLNWAMSTAQGVMNAKGTSK